MKSEFCARAGSLIYPEPLRHSLSDADNKQACRIEERVGHGMSELLFLEGHWRKLAASSAFSSFIHAFEWQFAYLKHLESNPEKTCYVSFFANGQAIAIFPLRRVRRSVGYIPHWLWELPTHPHLILGEPLIAPEWASSELVQRLLGVLNQNRNLPWDALHLPNMLEGSVAMFHLRAQPLSWMHLEQTGKSMFFRCTDLNDAMANCSSQFRRNLRRQGKNLAQHGTVSCHIARDGEALDRAFAEFLRLEASGWKGSGGRASAISLHPHLLGFYEELKDGFAKTDGCRIATLRLDDVAIAAQFCLLVGETLFVQKIGYDETWRSAAPGNQLLYRLLEYCCNAPEIRQLSLVTAPAWAVGRWNPESEKVWEAYLFKASPRGLGGLAMRRFKTGVGEPVQRLWGRARASLVGRRQCDGD